MPSASEYILAWAAAKTNERVDVLWAVGVDGSSLELTTFRDDKEVVLAAVQDFGASLSFASDALCNDKEVVLAAVSSRHLGLGETLSFASDELRNDREVVLTAVSMCALAMAFASEELRNDKEVVLAAVKQNGLYLDSLSDVWTNDKEVVLAAVKQDREAILYASASLQKDREVVLIHQALPLLKRVFKRFRWPRLVQTLLQFERDDAVFNAAFEPSAIEMLVDEAFLAGGDEVGPQPTPLWTAVTNKKRSRSEMLSLPK
jgi:hypothetical protein